MSYGILFEFFEIVLLQEIVGFIVYSFIVGRRKVLFQFFEKNNKNLGLNWVILWVCFFF